MCLEAFVLPFLDLLSLKRIRWYYRVYISRSPNLKQHELNKAFESPQPHMTLRILKASAPFLLSIYFTQQVPLAPYFGVIGTFFAYWVWKYQLLRSYTKPSEYNISVAVNLAKKMLFMLPLYLVLSPLIKAQLLLLYS